MSPSGQDVNIKTLSKCLRSYYGLGLKQGVEGMYVMVLGSRDAVRLASTDGCV